MNAHAPAPEPPAPEPMSLAAFQTHLLAEGFGGELAADLATRAVFATDNSVYERPPLAVVFPRVPEDLNRIARAAAVCGVAITARGGGTGTNGQSLTDAVIVDCSRYLTEIEEINIDEGYAVVQPGVILDQLNAAVAEQGLFFAPTVSTASRATLGGMAATDASGKGSRIYGRTSDHVLGLQAVLADGSDLQLSAEEDGDDCGSEISALSTLVRETLKAEADEIARVFPVMNRGLTGYNLQDALRNERLSLIKLLCGSEGTLALTKRLKLRLLPKPTQRALVVFAYDDIDAALTDVRRLVVGEPTAIEFIDDKILTLAQQDPIWSTISDVLAADGRRPVLGLNFVEVTGDTQDEIAAALSRLEALPAAPEAVISQRIVTQAATIADLWQLRSKCVGLLGRMDPTRQGTPFVEDAAVPAENLPQFVAEFRAILDGEGLQYGMFGHADVGCVHVRPALDMRRPEDAAMIRKVSDAVNTLALAHGGLIWGEHGKGLRGEYVPEVFGPRLYAAMCRIKAAFDPENRLNPGKIASPDPAQALTPIDGVPFRGPLDATIAPALAQTYDLAIKCNGNGQCMGCNFEDAMCPSYKATGDRRRAPKGRAVLLRQWARLQSQPAPSPELPALEAQLLESLSDCLGCKACASQCPLKVDIPKMRSAFYASYYARHRRPVAHTLLALLEPLSPVLRQMPALANAVLGGAAPLLRRLGLVDLPQVRPNLTAWTNTPHRADTEPRGKVMLLADSFLATFDGAVLDASAEVLRHLGYEVRVSSLVKTGKPLHVIGASVRFKRLARTSLSQLQKYAADGYVLVGLEPAFLSMFNNEYREITPDCPEVIAMDRFLHDAFSDRNGLVERAAFTLFGHCTEVASDPQTTARWKAIFSKCGLDVTVAQTGCCGMAGTFGHEADKAQITERLYDLSWRDKIESAGESALATGFSCRCQVKRFSGYRPRHPVEALRTALLDA